MDDMKYHQNIIVCGDWNGHIGIDRMGYEQHIGVQGIGEINDDVQRIMDFAMVNNLAIKNTLYQHKESHKWTWYRYNNHLQSYK